METCCILINKHNMVFSSLYYFKILHLIFKMYLCWVISLSLAGEPKIMKWFCRGSSITFSFFFCIYQIRGLQMEVSPPHILCMVMAMMFAFLSLMQHLLAHKTFSKEHEGFLVKVTIVRTKLVINSLLFFLQTLLCLFLVFRKYSFFKCCGVGVGSLTSQMEMNAHIWSWNFLILN